MKTKLAILSTIVAIAAINTVNANVNIAFNEPEKFADVSRSEFKSAKDRNYILEDIEEYMVDQIDHKVGDEYTVNVVVNNVDLAGEFEPWRMHIGSDVRIVKSIYPARLALDFEILDSEGQIVNEGSEKLTLRDDAVGFQLRNEESPYVKELINRWVGSLKV